MAQCAASRKKNARFLPWRQDAKNEHRAAKAKSRETEIGELGLARPFTPSDIVVLERQLGIADDVAIGRHRRRDTASDLQRVKGGDGVALGG